LISQSPKKDYENEAIEGGEILNTRQDYSTIIAGSIAEMGRVLKFNRWMSFVFAHKDPAYWHMIVDAAESVGFEYAGAVKQTTVRLVLKSDKIPSRCYPVNSSSTLGRSETLRPSESLLWALRSWI
jgi:hypothetical protein